MSYAYSPITNLAKSRLELDNFHSENPDDLTKTFFQLINKSNSNNFTKNGIYNAPRSSFLEGSQQIEKKIKWCMLKLKELDDISNRSSLFNSDNHMINEIIMNVKSNLTQVQTEMIQLLQNHDLRYSKDSETLAKNIVDNLNLRFMELTKQFGSALQKRSKTIRKYEEKSNKLKPASNKTKPNIKKGKKGEALFLTNNEADIEKSGQGENFVMVQAHELENEYLQSRSDSIRNIEKMLNEVAGIFQRISAMVHMQEVMVDRIDKDTEDTLVNVTKAKKHIFNIYTDVSSNRKMIFTVFFMMLIFSVMYIVVFL